MEKQQKNNWEDKRGIEKKELLNFGLGEGGVEGNIKMIEKTTGLDTRVEFGVPVGKTL